MAMTCTGCSSSVERVLDKLKGNIYIEAATKCMSHLLEFVKQWL